MSRARNEIVTRLGDQIVKLRRSPYLLMSYFSLLLIVLLGWLFSHDLIYLLKGGIKTWEDARGVGLFIGGVVASPIAFLSLHVGDSRLREQEKQTALHRETGLQQRYVDAVRLLSEAQPYQRTAGVTALRDRDIANNQTLMTSAATTLEAFIQEQGLGIQGEYSALVRRRVSEVREAMKTLFFLEDRSGKPQGYRDRPIDFAGLVLPHFNGNFMPPLTNVNFKNCDLSDCSFFCTEFRHVIFENCGLENATFNVPKGFGLRAGPFGSDISGATFIIRKNVRDAYKPKYLSCRYNKYKPPIVHSGAKLPPPSLTDRLRMVGEQYMTRQEAEAFWSQPGNDKYRPRDQDGNLIEIVYPDEQDENPASD